jgi:hypothetical protein
VVSYQLNQWLPGFAGGLETLITENLWRSHQQQRI